jgi:hypothetical protein
MPAMRGMRASPIVTPAMRTNPAMPGMHANPAMRGMPVMPGNLHEISSVAGNLFY